MFSEQKKDKKAAEELASSKNIIAQGTEIIGDICSVGDIRIDGTVEGHVKTSGKVVVGKKGLIKGSLQSANAHFEGTFVGKLELSGTLNLKASAHIEGDVTIEKLIVEPGAVFNVTCLMKSAEKEKDKNQQQKPAKTA